MTYIKRKSMKQESRVAKDFGGRVQLASGAIPSVGMKGDVRTGDPARFNEGDFLIENKFTDKNYFNFTRSVWEKIEREALKDGMRIPLLQVDTLHKKVFIMSLSDFYGFYEQDYRLTRITETGTNQIKLKDQYLPDALETEAFRFTMPYGTFVIIDYLKFTDDYAFAKGE